MLKKNLIDGQIFNYIVAMISVMLRPLRRLRNAKFCYYYFQFHREGDS